MTDLKKEIRFPFGSNWENFSTKINEKRISAAENSLKELFQTQTFEGKSFLDIGSGSGLFSLAAYRLGAHVHSFDYDQKSVDCTQNLKDQYFSSNENWLIEQGSIVDEDYIKKLGTFDYVYSWGVLHHTGNMWKAIDAAITLVNRNNGKICISIYNDQGSTTDLWTTIKKCYNLAPKPLKNVILIISFMRLWFPTILKDSMRFSPFKTWREYEFNNIRGMSPWYDVVDWVGGYPFEVAKPEELFNFFVEKKFDLKKLKTCGGGLGCNEYVFETNN